MSSPVPFRCLPLWVALACVVPAGVAEPQPTAGPPSSRREIATRVAEWEERFGRDAVRLQRALLARCVAAGAELGTEVTILGEVVRGQRRYLGFAVETGIVFDHGVLHTPDARARAVWSRVVEPALRDVKAFEGRLPGLWLELVSRHAPGGERETLLERLRHASAGTEHLHLRLEGDDAAAVARGGSGAVQAVRSVEADVDGRPVSIAAPADAPPR